jgi:4-diphosphocytidyl-2-C-methyl-D-erythritol kinase
MVLERFAPAKVNLFLHVGPVDAAGYHPVCSLMVFADVGDRLSWRPWPTMEFTVDGPFGGGVTPDDENLVVRARDALLGASGEGAPPFLLNLTKTLPIAAGLGGGSSDAAAALMLVRRALNLTVDADRLQAIARGLGSDVPACLDSASVIATGRGEKLSPAPPLPELDAVLVNPGAPSPTGQVYRAYDEAVSVEGANVPGWPDRLATATDVANFLTGRRNDLEAPAVALEPRIAAALRVLAAAPEALLARMSGSGATCFALCASRRDAETLAGRLSRDHPGWWVKACRLGAALN